MSQKHKISAPTTPDLLQWSVPRLIGAGYGLFSRKAANPRWPEFIITAFVLKKYREKSSFWFMVWHASRGMRKHEVAAGEAKAMLARLIGSRPRDIFQLSGIYRGLMQERGPAVATAAIVEIIRINNQKRTEKLAWYRPALKKTVATAKAKPRQKRHKSHPHKKRT